jgi:FkbM family methyltransferase
MVPVKINGKWDILLPKHRAERPEWYTDAGWERARLDAMSERIGPGDVVYYVGAEEGEMAALCQMWGALVYLFEPNPKVWPNTKAIWEANGLKDPVTFAGFASDVTRFIDHPDPRQVEVPAWGFPACAFEEVIGAHGFKELYLEADNYPQVKLDDVCREWAYKPPTVISFDVEGSEWQVLRGAQALLENHHPTLFASIHPEFMFHQWGEYSSDFRGWIKGFGYHETILDYQHELHCLYEWRA